MLKKILKTKLVSLLFSNNIIKKFVLRNSTIILVNHSISHRPSKFHKLYNLNVDPKLFEKQIIWLKKNFNLISPKELDTDEYEKPAVMITFDDGDKSYINNAVPILSKHKINSTVFLNMEVVKGNLSWACLTTYLINMHKEFKDYLIKKNHSKLVESFVNLNEKIVNSFFTNKNKKIIIKKARNYSGNFLTLADIKKLDKKKFVVIYLGVIANQRVLAINKDYWQRKLSHYHLYT